MQEAIALLAPAVHPGFWVLLQTRLQLAQLARAHKQWEVLAEQADHLAAQLPHVLPANHALTARAFALQCLARCAQLRQALSAGGGAEEARPRGSLAKRLTADASAAREKALQILKTIRSSEQKELDYAHKLAVTIAQVASGQAVSL